MLPEPLHANGVPHESNSRAVGMKGFRMLGLSLLSLVALEFVLCAAGAIAFPEAEPMQRLWTLFGISMLARVLCGVLWFILSNAELKAQDGRLKTCALAFFITFIMPFLFSVWYVQVMNDAMTKSCTILADFAHIASEKTDVVASMTKLRIECGHGHPTPWLQHACRTAIPIIVPIAIPVTFKLLVQSMTALTDFSNQRPVRDQQLLRVVVMHVVDICILITITFQASAFMWLKSSPNWFFCIGRVLPNTAFVATALLVLNIFIVSKKRRPSYKCFAWTSLIGVDAPFLVIRIYHMWSGIHVESVESIMLAKNIWGVLYALAEIRGMSLACSALRVLSLLPDREKVSDMEKDAEHSLWANAKCKAIMQIQRARLEDPNVDLPELTMAWEAFAKACAEGDVERDGEGNALVPEMCVTHAMSFLGFTQEEKNELVKGLAQLGVGAGWNQFKACELAETWARSCKGPVGSGAQAPLGMHGSVLSAVASMSGPFGGTRASYAPVEPGEP